MIKAPYKLLVGALICVTAGAMGVYSYGRSQHSAASSLAIQPLVGWASDVPPPAFDEPLRQSQKDYGTEMKTVLVNKDKQAVAAIFVRALNIRGSGTPGEVVTALAQGSNLAACTATPTPPTSGFAGCIAPPDESHHEATVLVVPNTMDRYFMILVISRDDKIDATTVAGDIYKRAHITSD